MIAIISDHTSVSLKISIARNFKMRTVMETKKLNVFREQFDDDDTTGKLRNVLRRELTEVKGKDEMSM